MAIIHIVMFKMSEAAQPSAVAGVGYVICVEQADCQVCKALVALQQECRHWQTSQSYIVSVEAGKKVDKDTAVTVDFTHAFVMKFHDEADLRYYLERDPAHIDFMKSLTAGGRFDGIVANVGTMDIDSFQ